MNEQALEIAVEFIKPFEGLCLRSYPDPASALSKALSARNLLAKYKRGEAEIPEALKTLSGAPWTIFYGETKGVSEGMTGTLEQAESRLKQRVGEFMAGVLKASPKLSNEAPEALAAITSLAYNIGLGAYAKSTAARCIAVGDDEGAADAILMWNKAGGQVMDGLKRRRAAERELFLKGVNKAAVKPTPEQHTEVVEKTQGGIMEKIWALLALFKKGKAVADPALWKTRQVSSTMIGMVLIAAIHVANLFGVNIHVDDATATTVGGVIIGIVNIVLTFTTSKTVGLAPKQAGAVVPEAVEPEAQPEAPAVQHVSIPDVAATITAAASGIEAWLAATHSAAAGNVRANDDSYRGV